MNVNVVVALIYGLWQDGRLREMCLGVPQIRGIPFEIMRSRFFLRILLEQLGGALSTQLLWISSQGGRWTVGLLDGPKAGPFFLLNLLVY
jgi:hypothetical protein